MGAKNIRISITSALNAAGIEATKQQVDEMSRSVAKSMAGAATANKRHWADIKAAWDMGCAAIRKAWQFASAGLKSAFKFETQTTQFKTLIGNIDEARAHMADLKALGDTPPFSLDEFAKASKSLMVMTDGALGYKKSLELIGDAAAATGTPIEEMGQAVGRLYAFIRDGQPLSRAVAQLRNMGILSPEVAQKLQDLQAAGKSNAEIWAEVETALGKYKGAMSETEKTGDGLVGAIKTRWENAVRTFGEALMEDAKSGLDAVNDAAKELEESGAIEEWADKTVEAAERAGGALATAAKKFRDFFGLGERNAQNTLMAGLGGIGAGIANAGEFGGGWRGFRKAQMAYVATHAANERVASGASQRLNSMMREDGEWQTDIDIREEARKADNEEAEERRTRRAEAKRAREAKKAEETAKREAAEKKRIEDSLAEGQKKKDARDAEEKAAKEAKAKEAAAKKAAETQARLDKEAAAARERQAQKELDQKIKNHQKLLAAENKAESEAHSRQAKAESKLQQAWGWYRDKDSMRAQLEEEKADAAARKQFDKDFEKLKSKHRDWRTVENLSVDDEAVRRVALAREEKEAADKHLAEIEKNTADLAAKLDELLSVKG